MYVRDISECSEVRNFVIHFNLNFYKLYINFIIKFYKITS